MHGKATTETVPNPTLRTRVETRKHELEAALANLGPDDRARDDIERALNEVSGLLTGDLDQIPRVVAAELSRWLESVKHVNEWHPSKNVVKH